MQNYFSSLPTVDREINYPETVTLQGIVSTHEHPRDLKAYNDGRAEWYIPLMAQVYEIAMCMGNTVPPLTSPITAEAKGQQWRTLVPPGSRLKLKVGGLMTEQTHPADVVAGYDQPEEIAAWDFMKMYVRAASNAHGADVDDMRRIIPVLKAMTETKFKHRKRRMTLAIHMERKYDLFGRTIHFLDRERVSVERDLSYLFEQVPDAKIVVCHVSAAYTIEVIRYLRSKGLEIYGELAPHYGIWTCDDLFEASDGGTKLNTKLFCLPIFKTEADRRAHQQAMLSGERWWVYGPDSACWSNDPDQPSGVKIDTNGFVTGGQTQLPWANVSYVIEKFIEARRTTEDLNNFLSRNAREAYGLDSAKTQLTFKRCDSKVPNTIEYDTTNGKMSASVAMGGQERKYVPDYFGL